MLLEKKNAMCLVNKNDNVLRPSLSEKFINEKIYRNLYVNSFEMKLFTLHISNEIAF